MCHTAKSARVLNVAAGVEDTDRTAPVRDGRHQALAVLIGKWINEGDTIGTGEIPSFPILTSDIYEWAPGGFFVVHSAFGRIGETTVGGVEIIGVDGDAYRSSFSTASATSIAHDWRSPATSLSGLETGHVAP